MPLAVGRGPLVGFRRGTKFVVGQTWAIRPADDFAWTDGLDEELFESVDLTTESTVPEPNSMLLLGLEYWQQLEWFGGDFEVSLAGCHGAVRPYERIGPRTRLTCKMPTDAHPPASWRRPRLVTMRLSRRWGTQICYGARPGPPARRKLRVKRSGQLL